VLRALEKEPERRYQQASEVKTQIESIVTMPANGSNEIVTGVRNSAEVMPPSRSVGRAVRNSLAGAGIGLLLGFAVVWVMTSSQPPSDRYPISLFVGIFLAAAGAIAGAVIGMAESSKGRQLASELPSAAGAATVASSDGTSVEQTRRQVQGPAMALLIAGMLNCLTIPMVVAVALFEQVSPHDVGTDVHVVGILLAILTLSITLVPGILTIVAAVKMKRLRAYWLAVVAGILAIVLSPAGFFIGLPIGIWALVVLSQRDVRTAFAQCRARA
jgi:hypothetical protein